jgi:hypothetical protein
MRAAPHVKKNSQAVSTDIVISLCQFPSARNTRVPVRQLEQHQQMADDRSHERSTSLLSSAVIEVEKTIQTLSASHDATAVTRRERSFVIKP